MDYDRYTYLSIALQPSSPYQADPSAFSSVHPSVSHVGTAGSLSDVHVVSVPKSSWEQSSNEIIAALNSADGVVRVDVQERRQRSKPEAPEVS
ncbi:hypothetical protein OF83DRAFT_1167231 [Amylostereum chailletii]|nr:hypothetical protein OF83DRAFT_1167231 [Amylostereum chailletii]